MFGACVLTPKVEAEGEGQQYIIPWLRVRGYDPPPAAARLAPAPYDIYDYNFFVQLLDKK